ncbi:MAG: hypothetical protein JNM00_14995 [Flavobacteriales bacterium]|nr:hypothetical protein [Flavobacteriales bacterium]
MSQQDLSALISLIEDPDESIYSAVRRELEERGETILPHLENWWECHDFGPLFHRRVGELIQCIQYKSVYTRLREWSENQQSTLLEGWLIINRYQYPAFDEYELKRQVSKLRQDIWLELNDELTALETVNVFNYILYRTAGFRPTSDPASQPQHYYLSDVLGSRSGNDVSMTLLYLSLAESLDIPIYGVDSPGPLLMCYANPVFDDLEDLDYLENLEDLSLLDQLPDAFHEDILFYIDALAMGAIVSRQDAMSGIKGGKSQTQPLLPCSHQQLLMRMMQSLITAYRHQGKEDKAAELETLHSVLAEKQDETTTG